MHDKIVKLVLPIKSTFVVTHNAGKIINSRGNSQNTIVAVYADILNVRSFDILQAIIEISFNWSFRSFIVRFNFTVKNKACLLIFYFYMT